MNVLKQAARAVRREFLAGDLLTVFAALVLGVAVMTAVGTLVDRVTLALTSSAAEVLGGDLGVTGRQEIPASFADEAQRRGLQTTRLVSFPSVLFHGESSQMANIRGVGAGYPLRGELLVSKDAAGTQAQ
ncbi:oxidoreductase, partial [Xanthomonas campestris]